MGAEVSLVTAGSGHLSQAKEFIQVHGLRNVGFESGEMTVDAHRRYSQELPCILTPPRDFWMICEPARTRGSWPICAGPRKSPTRRSRPF